MENIIDQLDKYCFSCWEWVPNRLYVHEEVQCSICSIAMSIKPIPHDDKSRSQYYNRVKYITEQNAHNVDGINLRGVSHQLDHMISIAYGFDNNIPPEHIAHTHNLQVIPSFSNRSKGRNNTITPTNRWILD